MGTFGGRLQFPPIDGGNADYTEEYAEIVWLDAQLGGICRIDHLFPSS